MREKIATTLLGFIFTVAIPALVSAMSPSLSLGVGVPAIGASILTGITVLVWGFAQHKTRTWRGKLLPICCMAMGAVIYGLGGYWYFRTHGANKASVTNTLSAVVQKPLNMWQIFDTDFPGVGRTMMTTSLSIAESSPQDFQIATYWDIPTNSYFFAMYFHSQANLYTQVFASASTIEDSIKVLNQIQIEISTPGDTRRTSLEQMTFSKQVFIYAEDNYDTDEVSDIQEAYRKLGYRAHVFTNTYQLLHANEYDRKPESLFPSLQPGTAAIRLPKPIDGMQISFVNVPLKEPLPKVINHLVRIHPSPAPP